MAPRKKDTNGYKEMIRSMNEGMQRLQNATTELVLAGREMKAEMKELAESHRRMNDHFISHDIGTTSSLVSLSESVKENRKSIIKELEDNKKWLGILGAALLLFALGEKAGGVLIRAAGIG